MTVKNHQTMQVPSDRIRAEAGGIDSGIDTDRGVKGVKTKACFLSYREPSFNYAECQEILQTSVGQKVKRTIFYWSIHMYIYFAIPVFLG